MKKKVTKVIKNTQADNLILLCKQSIRKTGLTAIIALIVFSACMWGLMLEPLSTSSGILGVVRDIAIVGAGISGLVLFVCLISLLGGPTGGGMLFARMDCKTDLDWLCFAERHTFIPETVTITKRLDGKEIVDVLYSSSELRCKDSRTGEDCVIKLSKPFEEVFSIQADNSLAEDEMVIDLSGNSLLALVSAKN